MAVQKGYSAGTFWLEIEGKFAGWLSTVEGGDPIGEVLETPSANGPSDKSISGVTYADITFTCGVPNATLGDWLVNFFNGQAPIHNGAVVFADNNRQPVRHLEWEGGHISAVTLPGLDGSSKDQAALTITIRAEVTRSVIGAGATKPNVDKGSLSKSLSASNFTVAIPGIDCSRTASVAPLMISQEFVPAVSRRGTAKPGPLKVGDLVLTVSQLGAADFVTWRDDFLVRGNNSSTQEKAATIRYLSPDFKAEFLSVNLQSVGIYRLSTNKSVRNAEVIARVTASMYCEQALLVMPVAEVVPAAPTQPAADGGGNLREFLGVRLEAEEVARRLRDTRDQPTLRSEVDRQHHLGQELGIAWAERRASLAELQELAAIDGQEWSSIALPTGHSLSEALEATGVTALQYDGRLELMRDSFVEGLLAGIVKVQSDLSDDLTDDLK